jgi:hypothetical protein
MLFYCSIIPCFIINFGPFAISLNHRGYDNLPGVPHIITALDNFDSTILFGSSMVMDFPPDYTVMLLLGCLC